MTKAATPTRSPMQSPETWDAVAAGYAAQAQRHAVRFAAEALARVTPGPGDSVLDVASGPGVLAFLAAPRAARVVGVDFSPRMIDELRRRATAEGARNVEGAVMDSRSLDFPDASFDKAYCMFGFMFFPDRTASFREILRVLRPGGRVLVGTWGPIDRRPLLKVGFDALAEALPSLPPPEKGALQSAAECVAEMTAAGFTNVEALPCSASTRVESAEQYLHFLERGGAPLVALRKQLGEDAWAAAHQRMLHSLRRKIPEGGADLTAEAILTSGARPAAT